MGRRFPTASSPPTDRQNRTTSTCDSNPMVFHSQSARTYIYFLQIAHHFPRSPVAPLRANMSTPTRSYTPLVLAFLAGVITTRVLFAQPQLGIHHSSTKFKRSADVAQDLAARAEPWVGSTEVHSYPPTRPTNYDPALFPSDVGYPGPTPTGAEPALLATAPAYPLNFGGQGLLIIPDELEDSKFDLLKKWGNLSPWYSVPTGTFGIQSGPETPPGCSVTGLHLLHRHGARYPTADVDSQSAKLRLQTDQTNPPPRFHSLSHRTRCLRFQTPSDWGKLDCNWRFGFFE